MVFRRGLLLGVVIGRKNLSKYNQEWIFIFFSVGGGVQKFQGGGGDDHMKNYAEFNIIIVDFIRIVIVFFKYNTFYFTYPPPPPTTT